LAKREQTSTNSPQPRVFVQTATPDQGSGLDRWRQITEDEAQMAHDMVLRNELSGGTQVVRDFEEMWRQRHDTRFAITVMNGTSALHSAMFGVGVGPGDEVICPVRSTGRCSRSDWG